MPNTPATFKVRFPEFCEMSDDRVQMFLDDAALLMGCGTGDQAPRNRWLCYYDIAQAYLAAHFVALGNLSADGDIGSVWPVKRQEVDEVVVEFGVPEGRAIHLWEDDVYSTTYGKTFAKYRRICFAGIYGV